MEDGVEFTGRTVEDAIAEAEAALGTGRNDLAIEVLSQGSRGVFGIGAEQARIRVTPMRGVEAEAVEPAEAREDTEEIAPDEVEGGSDVSEVIVSVEQPTAREAEAPEDLSTEAAQVLEGLLHSMGFDVNVTVRSKEDPIMLGVTGQNLGVLIGRRGDNLSAIQFMVNLILSKNRRQWPRVVVDVENYRARREESLTMLADRIAYRVQRNGRPFTLEAMPAGDRRVIHMALRDHAEVETYSIGEGPARRVVIAPKGSPQPSSAHGREDW